MIQIMNSLVIKNLSYSYPGSYDMILVDCNISFLNGANIMLIGDNGSGKSTFGKLISGLLTPTAGSILVCDKEISGLKNYQRIYLAYYITQINQLQFIRNTLNGEIKFAEEITKNKFEASTYELFSLPNDLEYNPFELDINEAWRLSLLISMIVDPFVLFIDEIPSGSNNLNKKALSFVLNQRKVQGQITFVAYQRKISFPFDRFMSFDIKEGQITNLTEPIA